MAGIERIDAAGRKLVFHSLRNTFATRLARQGAQRLAQELMRHSDPRLTARIDTDAAHLPTFDAVEQMSWTPAAEKRIPQKETESYDVFVSHADLSEFSFTFMR